MSGFQLDSLTVTPLDFPPPPARPEPRPEESFEDHLRRTPEPAPRARPEAPPRNQDRPPAERDAAADATRPAAPDKSTRENKSDSQPAGQVAGSKKPNEREEGETDGEQGADDTPVNVVADSQAKPPANNDEAALAEGQAQDKLAAIAEKNSATSQALAAVGKLSLRTKVARQAAASSAAEEAEATSTAAGTDKANAATPETETDAKSSHGAQQGKPKPELEAANPGKASSEPKAARLVAQDADAESGEQPSAANVAQAVAVDKSDGQGRQERDGDHRSRGHEELTPLESQAQARGAEPAVWQISAPSEADALPTAAKVHDSASPEPVAQAAQPDAIAGPGGRLPQQLLSRPSDHSQPGKPLTEADQGRFVQRVARAFQTAANQEGELRLRLSPPELGSLRLEVKVQGGVMSARIEAESSATRTLLLDNLPALRERLAEQNIRLEQFDVDLMDRQGGGQPNGMPQDQGRQPGSPTDAAARFRTGEEPTEEPATARPTPRGVAEGKLNVLV